MTKVTIAEPKPNKPSEETIEVHTYKQALCLLQKFAKECPEGLSAYSWYVIGKSCIEINFPAFINKKVFLSNPDNSILLSIRSKLIESGFAERQEHGAAIYPYRILADRRKRLHDKFLIGPLKWLVVSIIPSIIAISITYWLNARSRADMTGHVNQLQTDVNALKQEVHSLKQIPPTQPAHP